MKIISDKYNQQGFTLLELLIVIAVIGLLASFALPQFSSFRDKALDSDAVSNIKQIELHQRVFNTDNSVYVGFVPVNKIGGSLVVAVGAQNFKVESLSDDVDVLSQVSADGQSVIVAAKHKASQTIIALDLDDGSMRKLENQAVLTPAVIPASTSGNDLSVWAKY